MVDSRILTLPVAGLVLAAALAVAAGQDEKPAVAITPTRAPGNVFGDQEGEFRLRVEATRAAKELSHLARLRARLFGRKLVGCLNARGGVCCAHDATPA